MWRIALIVFGLVVIVLVVQAASRVVEDVEASSRGQSGFGSTGRG